MPTKTLSRRSPALATMLGKVIPARYLPKALTAPRPLVPVVRLHGAIGVSPFPGQSGLSLAGVVAQLEAAFEAKGAVSVALLINSPGGSPAQSHLIHQRIRALADEHKRPVFAFIEDVGASGGYMLACAADEIFADPTSVVGSIGVVSAGFGLTGLIEKLGIERRIYTAGHSKAMLDPFMPEREEEVVRLKELQADVHESFIALVKASRRERLTGSDEDLFSGAFWTGRKALGLGLIDGLGDVRSTLRERFGEEVDLRLVPAARRGGLLRALLPNLSGGAALPDGRISLVDADNLISALETRALWGRYGL
jgi:signal peptide peptidase SppA